MGDAVEAGKGCRTTGRKMVESISNLNEVLWVRRLVKSVLSWDTDDVLSPEGFGTIFVGLLMIDWDSAL